VQTLKQIEMQLACELSQEEIQFRAQELGVAVAEYDVIDDEKKSAMKLFKERLEVVAHRMRRLSKIVQEKREYRMVACVVEFHVPAVGSKRIVRTDTGEIVREEAMTPEERQNNLFEGKESEERGKRSRGGGSGG
jgi:hypothetical protein